MAKEYPNAIICLQEVTEEIGRRIAEVFPTSVQREENMIIVPENLHIDDVQSLSYGRRTRTFLQAEISQGDDSPFFLVT